MSNELVKAALDALAQAIIDSATVVKKHESVAASLVDAAELLLADQKLKADVGALMVAGFSGVLAQVKGMGSDISGDIQLVVEELPVIQKVIAALSA